LVLRHRVEDMSTVTDVQITGEITLDTPLSRAYALPGTYISSALLAGDNSIEKNFTLRDAGEERGVNWVEATPKAQDSGFEKVRLGFVGNELKAMELLDSLGQTTSLLFARIERNPRLNPTLFRFTPPPRTDVIGE
jgi:outer membrane lipoprotein carrier protein